MTSTFNPSTPSPPRDLPTPPPAPRFGTYLDKWQPYGPRKSARISSRRTTERTPSPSGSSSPCAVSPRKARNTAQRASATMVSPAASPQKKRQPSNGSGRSVSGTLTAESSADAAAALGLRKQTSSSSKSISMLPTPSKTPQKPPAPGSAAELDAFARNLFPAGESSNSEAPQKRAKKYTGVTMDSFRAEEVEEPFEIFTDSRDRIPKKDESASNPFYGTAGRHPEPIKRRGKRKHVTIPGEGPVPIEEAASRDDGMVFNFRGKSFFRKYADDKVQFEDWNADEVDVEAHLAQPMTRSSIKPRLLFPPKDNVDVPDEDEEAMTDVEDHLMSEVDSVPQTPVKALQEPASTPGAPRFAPISPPDTKRITRSTNKIAPEKEKLAPGAKKADGERISPFASWRRTKDSTNGSAEKRQAESIGQSQTKRTRT